jgi:eukaryotic-like serine/threonine-protein kinase
VARTSGREACERARDMSAECPGDFGRLLHCAMIPAAMKLAPGAVIRSTYRLERPLAAGGMGSVWVASHMALGAQVAVKFIDAEQTDPMARTRFQREAQSLAAIHNPHVVAVHDYGMEDETPFIVMDLLSGEDLGARLRRVRRLSLPDASCLLAQIARGLRAAHAAGIVHRDLKPGNVFLAAEGGEETVKILDFGVAKNAASTAVGEGTKIGDLVGSPQFMSPEQIRSPTSVDARSDLWSLSVILFRGLTGELPFKSKQIGQVLAQILTDPIPTATHVAPDLPPALDAFFARGLARDPALRFQCAQEMAHELARIASQAGSPDPSVPEADPPSSGAMGPSGPSLADSMGSAAPAVSASASHPAPGTPQGSWSAHHALAPMLAGSGSGQPIPPPATTAAPSPAKLTAWLPWLVAVAAVAAALSMGVLVATRRPAPDDAAKPTARVGASAAVLAAPQPSLAPPPADPAPAAATSTSAAAEPASPDLSAAPGAPLPSPSTPRAHGSQVRQKRPNWGF